MDSEGESRRKGTRVLAPADLQTPVVQRETLVRSHLEESESGCGIDEGDELEVRVSICAYEANLKTYSDVLVLHISDALQDSPTNSVA